MMGRSIRIGKLGWLLALLLGVACAGPMPRHGNEQFQSLERGDYLRALDAWTEKVELYHQFDTRLLAEATLISPQFRQAWRRELARTYRLNDAEVQAQEAKLMGGDGDAVEMLVWTASETPKLASLLEKDRMWALKLFNAEGQYVSPVEVTQVKRPTAVDRHFFPYATEFGRTWRVKFAKAPETGTPFFSSRQVTLQLAGVQGVAELSWDLAEARVEGGVSSIQ